MVVISFRNIIKNNNNNFYVPLNHMPLAKVSLLSIAVGMQLLLSGCSHFHPFSVEKKSATITSDTIAAPQNVSIRQFSPSGRFKEKRFQNEDPVTPAKPIVKKEKRQQRLADLDLEIQMLEVENERIQQKTAYLQRQKQQIAIQQDKENLQTVTHVSKEYAELKQDVATAQQDIQRQLQQLQLIKSAEIVPVFTPVMTSDNNKNSQEFMAENQMYFTVYVTTEKFDWISLWGKLQNGGVEDKWKGFSSEKSVYFIYVGAYGQLAYAEKRKQDLEEKIGQAPDIVQSNTREKMDKIALLVLKNRG